MKWYGEAIEDLQIGVRITTCGVEFTKHGVKKNIAKLIKETIPYTFHTEKREIRNKRGTLFIVEAFSLKSIIM